MVLVFLYTDAKPPLPIGVNPLKSVPIIFPVIKFPPPEDNNWIPTPLLLIRFPSPTGPTPKFRVTTNLVERTSFNIYTNLGKLIICNPITLLQSELIIKPKSLDKLLPSKITPALLASSVILP